MSATARRRVFVSYARDDSPAVDRLVAALDAAGWQCWIDRRDLYPGDPWEPELTRAIDEAHAVVVAVTARASHSRWVRRDRS